VRIAIVGPGRLGRTLAVLLARAGHDVALVGRAAPLPDVDAVWLTVPDLAIAEVASDLPPGPIALHASGATGLEVFGGRPRSGSLHPLMTFPGPDLAIPDLRGVPAAVAGDAEAIATATALAGSLEMSPFEVPGDRRLYHAAAVLAGNGATILLAHACRALETAGVPADRCVDVLLPLALRSIAGASPEPARALTGPIARGEHPVIEAHLRALREAGLDDAAELHAAIARAGEAALRDGK
jgi:predicted short-subunit dehydrogenase-like oxidoreductase (DUF2520 family)